MTKKKENEQNMGKIQIKKQKGEDGYTSFSLRIPLQLSEQINELVSQTELSRNEFLTILIREALKEVELVDPDKKK